MLGNAVPASPHDKNMTKERKGNDAKLTLVQAHTNSFILTPNEWCDAEENVTIYLSTLLPIAFRLLFLKICNALY